MDEDEFRQFYQPKMDRSVSNVGVQCEGAVVMFAFQQFLDEYLDQEETVSCLRFVAGSYSW